MTRNRTVRTAFAVLGGVTLLLVSLYALRGTHLALARWLPQPRPATLRVQPAALAAATLSLTAPADPVPVGQTFTVTVSVSGQDAPLSAFQFDLGYDPDIIRFVGLEPGADLKGTGRSVVCPQGVALNNGVRLACATTGETGGLSTSGNLAVLTFLALAGGQTDLTLSNIQLPSDARPPQLLAATGQGAGVTVEAACAQVADLRAGFRTAEPALPGTGGGLTRSGTAEPLQAQSAVVLTARVTNGGTTAAAAGIRVAFYRGDPDAGGTLIGTAQTSKALGPGESEDVSVTWTGATAGDHTIFMVADDDGTGAGQLAECSEADNRVQQLVSILDVPLAAGWNLMSSYVDPFTKDVSVVQRPISGTYVVIQGFDQGAQSYYPDMPGASTLKEIDAEHGYWIKMLNAERGTRNLAFSIQHSAFSWRFVGRKFAEDQDLPLDAGWNLVSYLPRASMPVTQALGSIEGQYTAVLGFDGGALSYYPDIDPIFNTLKTLEPLHGYWIKMKQAGTLRYPVTAQGNSGELEGTRETGRAGESPPSSSEFLRVPPSPTWVNFYGPTSLPAGTLIQAVDPQGVVCGAAMVHAAGKYGLLACYGDDPTTPEDEGAQPGDVIRLVVDGETLATGVWTAHGERQWVPLGAVRLWQVWLPVIVTDGWSTDR